MERFKAQNKVLILALWGILVALVLWYRPLLPVDETRYLAVAWEMWLREDFLVPYLNGQPYSHKPPLLFWLMHAGWAVFGVNDVTPRLVAPLFGLISLLMTMAVGRRLWPQKPEISLTAPLILIGGAFWALYTTLTMFDMLNAAVTTTALFLLLKARDQGRLINWVLLGVALGVGGLAKGPVILLYVLPIALLAPWWDVRGVIAQQQGGWRRWYRNLGIAVVIGLGIASLWVIPAAIWGGEEYREAILWGQTAGRVVNSFAHKQPFWWYGMVLPVSLLPWLIWPPFWRSVGNAWTYRNRPVEGESLEGDMGVRFCLSWVVPALMVFSAVSGKQPHYMLPLFPAIALLMSYFLIQNPRPGKGWDCVPAIVFFVVLVLAGIGLVLKGVAADKIAVDARLGLSYLWLVPVLLACVLTYRRQLNDVFSVAALMVVSVISLHGVALPLTQTVFDLKPLAMRISDIQQAGRPVAHMGKYHGQYQFLGRLENNLDVVNCMTTETWMKNNPDGAFLTYRKYAMSGAGLSYLQPYRGKYVALWSVAEVTDSPDAVKCQK